MRKIVPAAGLAVLTALPVFSDAALAAPGDCTVPPLALARQIETYSTMTVRAGKACGRSLAVPGTIQDIQINQRPRVGRVGIRGSAVFYAAKPGYTGPDEYTYTYIGSDPTGPIKIVIRQKVEVVP